MLESTINLYRILTSFRVFSSGQTTADYIPFESLDRVKVHSLATKALSKRTSKWGLKRRHVTYWLMAFAIGLLTGITSLPFYIHNNKVSLHFFHLWVSAPFKKLELRFLFIF